MSQLSRFYIISCLLLTTLGSTAADTLRVTSHNKITVVTDPSKGFKLYNGWGVFPSVKEQIRQIKLKVRMGCPDTMRCADWDYKDHITIRRTGGVKGASKNFEIGRMLTPYGGAFGKDWKFDWEIDVTDFSLLLRDSVEIEYNHNGYEPNNDRGWAITVSFEIITGKPAWEPVAIHRVYDSAYKYGDSSNNIENQLTPFNFIPSKETSFARLRVVQTGHGSDRPDGCGEFCNKYRDLLFDGKQIDRRAIWKKCGDNALYPQAGTWIYNRANWCPGDLINPDIYNLKVQPGKTHSVQLVMQPYTSTRPSAEEWISAYLIEYRQPSSSNDVRIDDIMVPSSKDVYSRLNPTLINPKIIITNTGMNDITSLRIRYGTWGFPSKDFTWRGKLPAFATDTLNLPGPIQGKPGMNDFLTEVARTNGKQDGYPSDNVKMSQFELVKSHDSTVIIYLLTNNQAGQTGYTLRSGSGSVIKERKEGSLTANTVYRDTLKLTDGNYVFTISDSANNGLEFWANPRGGRGKARLLNKNGAMLKDFESDFGTFSQYAFSISPNPSQIEKKISMGLYPTRTNDKTTLDYYSNFPHNVVVKIVSDPGDNIAEEHRYPQLKEGTFTYDLSRFPKGRFYLVVEVDGKEEFKKRIRLKE